MIRYQYDMIMYGWLGLQRGHRMQRGIDHAGRKAFVGAERSVACFCEWPIARRNGVAQTAACVVDAAAFCTGDRCRRGGHVRAADSGYHRHGKQGWNDLQWRG